MSSVIESIIFDSVTGDPVSITEYLFNDPEISSISRLANNITEYLFNDREISSISRLANNITENIVGGDKIYLYECSFPGELTKSYYLEYLKKGIILKNTRKIEDATVIVLDEDSMPQILTTLRTIQEMGSIACEKRYFRKIPVNENADEFLSINGKNVSINYLCDTFGDDSTHYIDGDPSPVYLYIDCTDNIINKVSYIPLSGEKLLTGNRILNEDGSFFITNYTNYGVLTRILGWDKINKHNLKFIDYKDYIKEVMCFKSVMNFQQYSYIQGLLHNELSKSMGCNLFYTYNHFIDPSTHIYARLIHFEFETILTQHRAKNAFGFFNIDKISQIVIDPWVRTNPTNPLFSASLVNIIDETKCNLDILRMYQLSLYEELKFNVSNAFTDMHGKTSDMRWDIIVGFSNNVLEKVSPEYAKLIRENFIDVYNITYDEEL